MKMELLQLKYFLSAAQTENFSKTASQYLVPTSNISQTIKRLEAELECPLFDRSANRIKLNKEGRLFYEGVKNAFGALEAAKQAVTSKKDSIDGEIKLSICTDRRLVTKAIQHFKEQYPAVSFSISHSEEQAQDSDIIISDRIESYDGYTKTLLTREEILLAVADGTRLEIKSKDKLASQLKELRYITMPPSSSLYRHTVSICHGFGFEPNITIVTDDPFYIRKYVSMGLGVAFVPSVSWQGQFDENVRLYSVGQNLRNTYIFKKTHFSNSLTVDTFCDCLGKSVEQSTQKH